MKRICLIDVAALSGRLLESAGGNLRIQKLASPPRPLKPTLPAVTCSVQASLTTGVDPEVHGIIANGMFFRESRKVSFWEASNTLLAKKRFWHSRRLPQAPKVAMLFWQNPLAGGADIVLAPKYKPAGNGGSFECFSQPADLYGQLAEQVGPFDGDSFWGPGASVKCSEWLTRCAVRVWKQEKPDLQLVYLPQLDYSTQRFGPDDPRVAADLIAVDALVGEITDAVQADGGEVVIVSGHGTVPVRQAVTPNLLLRQAGLLAVREEDGREYLDLENSHAFAMVDHQIAHVYCRDHSFIPAVRKALGCAEGVGRLLAGQEIEFAGLGHFRSGEVVLLARPDAWFAYHWWSGEAKAPSFAHSVNMQGKCGYDPCELLGDAEKKWVPADPSRIGGSYGLVEIPPRDFGVLAGTCDVNAGKQPLATDLPEILKGILFGR